MGALTGCLPALAAESSGLPRRAPHPLAHSICESRVKGQNTTLLSLMTYKGMDKTRVPKRRGEDSTNLASNGDGDKGWGQVGWPGWRALKPVSKHPYLGCTAKKVWERGKSPFPCLGCRA